MNEKWAKFKFSFAADLNSFTFESIKRESDKQKHQFVSESHIADDLQPSSTKLTLQQLNQETEKKEAAAEAAKVRCRLCFKEIAPTRRCFGHGGGGGGGSDGGGSASTSEAKALSADDKTLSTSAQSVEESEEIIGEFASTGAGEGLESHADEKSFDPEIIAELIAQGLLLVDNDREAMTLTIRLQCEPNLLTEEQRHEFKKYMEAVVKEFNEFKEENNLADECLQCVYDEEGTIISLRITMPTLALYDAFIQRLANNLLCTPNPEAQKKEESRKEQRGALNPFSMEPIPSYKDKSSAREEREHHKDREPEQILEQIEDAEKEIFNPSPFKMTAW